MKEIFHWPTVSIVVRWFQPRAGHTISPGTIREFDVHDFELRLRDPLTRFIRCAGAEVQSITIVSNADPHFSLGEALDANGMTPTTRAVYAAFPMEIRTGFIRTVIETNWGNNAGSAQALNTGWRYAVAHDNPEFILSWNPEMEMTGGILARMLTHHEQHGLDIVGAYRQRYWSLYQWQLPQNTACLYAVKDLLALDGFDVQCDGNNGETITIPGIGEVTLAGMEDFDFCLRFFKHYDRMPRWGMVGRANPFLWNVDFQAGTERALMLRNKIARQPAVIEHRARQHFPPVPYVQFMDRFFANRHED